MGYGLDGKDSVWRSGQRGVLSGMRRLLAFFAATGIALACGPTEPIFDPVHCLYPGDTIGVLPFVRASDSVTTRCIWVQEDRVRCYRDPIADLKLSAAKDCVVGEKWTG